jgi:hypothetical protein
MGDQVHEKIAIISKIPSNQLWKITPQFKTGFQSKVSWNKMNQEMKKKI